MIPNMYIKKTNAIIFSNFNPTSNFRLNGESLISLLLVFSEISTPHWEILILETQDVLHVTRDIIKFTNIIMAPKITIGMKKQKKEKSLKKTKSIAAKIISHRRRKTQ